MQHWFAIVLCVFGVFSSAIAVDAADRQKPLNDSVRAQLARQGDNGKTPREVDHFAYPDPFRKSAQRLVVKEWLEQNSFAKVESVNAGGLHFVRETAVAGQGFDKLTQDLADHLEKLGWEYDGWGTVAVTKD